MGDVLFCPFCRESFEGEQTCPEHELPLVPFFDLPKQAAPVDEHARVAWYSPALGRGPVAAAAFGTLAAFLFLPLAGVDGPTQMGGTMLRLAREGTPKLWLVPSAAAAMLLILARRRSRVGLRGLRVLIPLLACVPPLVVFWSWLGVEAAVVLMAARTGQDLAPRLGSGASLVLIAALPALVFGLRLGGKRR